MEFQIETTGINYYEHNITITGNELDINQLSTPVSLLANSNIKFLLPSLYTNVSSRPFISPGIVRIINILL